MKDGLRASREALEFLWHQGLTGKSLLSQHTDLIDADLSYRFKHLPEAQKGMALVALGGYGRSELFPYSDIDLMLLYDPAAEKHVGTVAENIFYPLWDAGLEVGHAVRSPDDCLTHGAEDFYFQVAMLDARKVAGSESLFRELREVFKKKIIEGHRRDFFKNMSEHRKIRHQRYGMHIYQLEPNIKETHGGLRDIQSMLWTANVVFGLHDLANMEDAGLLSGKERHNFEEAWDHLIKIRNRLHYLSKRKNDRLYFEYQEEIAEAFGYETKNEVLGVEQFMQRVYMHLNTVAVTTDNFFEHTDEVLNLEPKAASEKKLEAGIVIRHGRIQISNPELPLKKPELLMHVFAHAAKLGVPIHYRTRKLVTECLDLVNDKLRSSKKATASFLDTLQGAEAPQAALNAMLETGLLTRYIPEFEGTISLAQHDVYHTYTVDRHLLQCVEELKTLRIEEGEIFASLKSPGVLYLAALLHDIGKGRGGDHSSMGAGLAETVGKRLGLSQENIDALVFLVQNHLFLINTALRRDLDDESFIIRCAQRIKTTDRLNMLYLLSIADSRATGEGVWNEWKAALLFELYLKISHLLGRSSELSSPDKKQSADWMRSKVARLLDRVETLRLNDLPAEYLLSFTPETIAGQIRLSQEAAPEDLILKTEDHGHYWSVLVMAPDSIGLLSKICGTFALHNLDVVAAQIFTWENGTAVDMLNVHSSIGESYHGQDWPALERNLALALDNRLGLVHRLVGKNRLTGLGVGHPGLTPKAQVFINNSISDRYTVMEIIANNHSALLFGITRTLAEFCINIARAKIGTKGDQVVDVFYVLDQYGKKIEEKMLQEEITRALLHVADKESSATGRHHLRCGR